MRAFFTRRISEPGRRVKTDWFASHLLPEAMLQQGLTIFRNMNDMDIRHPCVNSLHAAGNRPSAQRIEPACLVTGILRDLIEESPAPTQRFLAAVVAGMDRYQHHATHIALGAIAELLRVSRMDAVTKTTISDIIQAVNHHC